jgi:hypothetical protein
MSNNEFGSVEWLYNEMVIKLYKLQKIEYTHIFLEELEQAKAKYEHEMCVFADEYASYVLEQSKSGIKGAMVSMCAWTFFKNRRNEQQ